MTRAKGFTLIELIMVITLLGIIATGFIGVISVGSKVFIDVTTRDKYTADARFLALRMSRELQEALPNSIRINSNCLEFIPTAFSTVYTDIPTGIASSSQITAIDFNLGYNQLAKDRVVIYPTSEDDGYDLSINKAAELAPNAVSKNVGEPTIAVDLTSNMTFSAESPNATVFFVSQPISYCVNASVVERFENYGFRSTQLSQTGLTNSTASKALMARNFSKVGSTFVFHKSSGLVELNLGFVANGETFILKHGVNVFNVP